MTSSRRHGLGAGALLACGVALVAAVGWLLLVPDADRARGERRSGREGLAPQVTSAESRGRAAPPLEPLAGRLAPAAATTLEAARLTPLRVWQPDLTPAAFVDVLVLDAEGTPTGPVARTDATGQLELELPAAGWLAARNPGDLASTPPVAVASLRENPRERDVVLLPTGRVAARVFPRNEADGVWVRATTTGGRPSTRTGLDLERRAPAGSGEHAGEPIEVALRGVAPGRFELDVDAPMTLRIFALRGSRRGRDVVVHVEPGQRTNVQLAPPGPFAVWGQVVDHKGDPVPAAIVSIWSADNTDAYVIPRDDVRADAHGRFHADLDRPGSWIVSGARPGGVASSPRSVDLQGGAPDAQLLITLPRPARITGQVVDGLGAPWPEVTVHARPAHLYDHQADLRAPTAWTRLGSARSSTDADGRFVLEPLHPEGNYIIFARPDEQRPERKLVLRDVPAGSEDVLLVASESALARARVSALVRSGVDGGPVSHVQPTLLIELDGQVVDTEQDELDTQNGAFELEGLAPGYRYRLQLKADGLGAVELPWFEASANGTHFDVTLPMLATLEVDATRGQAPASRATILVKRLVEDFTGDLVVKDLDELGQLRLEGLRPGRHRVVFMGGAFEDEIELLPGETLRLRAPLR